MRPLLTKAWLQHVQMSSSDANSTLQTADAFDSASRQAAREVDRHVAGRLRKRRLELGITQQMLARAVGLSYQQIQKYETAVNRIGAGRLFCVAKALGVRQSYFFAGLDSDKTLEELAITALRGESALPLEPAVRRAIFRLLDSLD